MPAAAVERAIRMALPIDREVAAFYRDRAYRPLWIDGGRLRPEAGRILELVSNAEADGLDPMNYRVRALGDALRVAASGRPADLGRAEALLSRAVATYVRDLRRPAANIGMTYVDGDLMPAAPSARAVLDQLADAPSLASGLQAATTMNPLYTQLREAYAAERARGGLSLEQERGVRASLERLRALPADLGRRFVLVDAASAKLWMYEDGEAKGSMKVVIGRPGEPTPKMAAYIREARLNPYWNVPPDLVQRLIAPNVLSKGEAYLRTAGYQVMSDWSEEARPVPASAVDWNAVADGSKELPLRQLPGPQNSMGRVKFMFPNQHGVYLHDTPNRELFSLDDRRRSAGCVRLEDASRLGRWLFGRPLPTRSRTPEEAVPLPEPVPVYITYLTAMPANGGRIAFNDDHYDRDGELLAQGGSGRYAAAR